MSFFSQSFLHSRLLRPWVRLAITTKAEISKTVTQSKLLPFHQQQEVPQGLHPKLGAIGSGLLTLGVGALFLLASFSSTGLIGGFTWLLLLGVLVFSVIQRPQWLQKLNIVDGLVACFLGSAALSTAFSSFFQTSVIGFAKMLTFVAGYVVFRVVSQQGNRVCTALLGLLVCIGLGESLIGFYQHINHIQPLATWSDPSVNPELQMDRIFGTLKPSNPNLLAGFLTPCLTAAIGLGLLLMKGRTRIIGILSLLAVPIILVAMVWTGSRGGYLAIGTILICFFAMLGHLIWHLPELKNKKWMKPAWLMVLILSITLVAAGIVSSEKIRARVASIFAMREDSSISYRLNVYQSASQMFRDNPIVGIGPGNSTFKLVYGLYMVPGYNALGAYSVPLEIAVEQGAIGLVIFLSLLLVLKIRTFIALDSNQLGLSQKLLIITCLSGVLGSFMYGIFDTIWYRPSVNLLFWFMVAQLSTLTEPAMAALPEKETGGV